MAEIITRKHWHDNDGLPDQLEVIEAPREAWISLLAFSQLRSDWMELWWGDTLVFGTPDLGQGRVAYRVDGFAARPPSLLLHRRTEPLPCCDMHNHHCEPPSELCCEACTEIEHPEHRYGSPCVLTAPAADHG